jgi:ribonuclease HII
MRFHKILYKGKYTTVMLVGIDESGRGPVLGPLIVCGVSVTEHNNEQLESLQLRDSKKYSRSKREELASALLSLVECEYAEIPASSIDIQRCHKTLNDIEIDLFSRVLSRFSHARTIIVDACDVDATRFGRRLCFISKIPSLVSEHKADERYPIVSAASIIAKVRRDARIDELKKVYGDIGSGYPSDKKTITFLKEYIKNEGKLPPIARSSWLTSKNLLNEYFQRTLDIFL